MLEDMEKRKDCFVLVIKFATNTVHDTIQFFLKWKSKDKRFDFISVLTEGLLLIAL